MTTEHFIIELFCRVDDQIPYAKKHSQAALYPSEVVKGTATTITLWHRKKTRARVAHPQLSFLPTGAKLGAVDWRGSHDDHSPTPPQAQ